MQKTTIMIHFYQCVYKIHVYSFIQCPVYMFLGTHPSHGMALDRSQMCMCSRQYWNDLSHMHDMGNRPSSGLIHHAEHLNTDIQMGSGGQQRKRSCPQHCGNVAFADSCHIRSLPQGCLWAFLTGEVMSFNIKSYQIW